VIPLQPWRWRAAALWVIALLLCLTQPAGASFRASAVFTVTIAAAIAGAPGVPAPPAAAVLPLVLAGRAQQLLLRSAAPDAQRSCSRRRTPWGRNGWWGANCAVI
jgi:hypothetical protein